MSWPAKELRELVDIRGGGTPSKSCPEYWNGPIPWASVKDFKTTMLSETADSITPLGVENSATTIIPAGNIIVPTRMALGKVAVNTVDMAINQDLKALVVKDERVIHKQYLFRYLESQAAYIERQGKGATVKGITLDVLRDLPVPLPPLPEQKRIAAILDKADAIRRKRQQAIQLADDFLRAVFLDMFGDPVTNPKGWEMLPFSMVGTLDRGKSKHRPRNDPALLGGQHPLIQTGEVANSRGYIKGYSATYSDLGLAQSKKWDAGTLCITIAANIAKTGILTFPACFPDSVVGFVPNKHVTVEYVQHWLGLLQKNLEENAPQAAQKNINLEILRALQIPVPTKEKQEEFSKIVANIIDFEEKIDRCRDALNDAFESISQRAFSGKL